MEQMESIQTDSPDQSWSEITAQIAAGDQRGIENLYQKMNGGVRSLLSKNLVDHRDFEDALHEVSMVVVESIKGGNIQDPDRLAGYIRVVAIHLIDHMKKHMRRREQENDGQAIVCAEQRDAAMRVLEAMGPRDREILVRYYLREQPKAQIMQAMGIAEHDFWMLIAKARNEWKRRSQESMN
jgi:RNA polymerase sigma-70 factor (ECF subfamily)